MRKVAFLKLFSLAKTVTFLSVSLFCLASDAVSAERSPRNSGRENPGVDAQKAFERGDFARAAGYWREAARGFESLGDARAQILALADAGAAHQLNGEAFAAQSALQEALRIATRTGDRSGLALVQNNLGSLLTLSRQPVAAEAALRASLQLAQANSFDQTAARAFNNLGNLLAMQDRDAQAQEAYEMSTQFSLKAGDPVLGARATLNLASVMRRADKNAQATTLTDSATTKIQGFTQSHEKAQLLLAAAHSFRLLAEPKGAQTTQNLERAANLDTVALSIADKLQNPRLQSLSLGALGEIHEIRGEAESAKGLTRRARFIAQQNQLPDLLFQWEWQIGRLLKGDGQIDDAISAYRRSIETLRTLGDCEGLVGSDINASFRDSVGPLYYQMADLLLKRSDATQDPQKLQKALAEAREVIELLKTAEISDYFQDSCVAAGMAKVADVDSVLKDAAIVYYIPLPDRLEILLGLESGLQRFTVPIKSTTLNASVRRFRLQLERPATDRFLTGSQTLYDSLIRPMETELAAKKIKTLVFISDGALRTIPMGALSDGKQFVIEKFGVALTPGLTLMDPRPLNPGAAAVFAGGVSDSVQGFQPLASVADELRNIEQSFGAKPRLNSGFLKSNVAGEISDGQYSIVHLASHGEFNSNPKRSFLLTYDGKLTMDDLENMIRPHQFQGRPVELLVLSACQTASGDDRAALGLAGAALKSGARSVMASLWSVSDEATSVLVKGFYAELKRDPTQSKTTALQKAQIELLRNERFRHPAMWAPYSIIGNWL